MSFKSPLGPETTATATLFCIALALTIPMVHFLGGYAWTVFFVGLLGGRVLLLSVRLDDATAENKALDNEAATKVDAPQV